jgi:hypothetical protein
MASLKLRAWHAVKMNHGAGMCCFWQPDPDGLQGCHQFLVSHLRLFVTGSILVKHNIILMFLFPLMRHAAGPTLRLLISKKAK